MEYMNTLIKKMSTRFIVILILAASAFGLWWILKPHDPDSNFASGNGRVEATEIDVAAKAAGRIKEIFVDEGDMVKAGQVAARMDTQVLTANLIQAQAQVRQAQNAKATAQAIVAQRESEKATAHAIAVQRESELLVAQKKLQRSEILVAEHAVSAQEVDDDSARMQSAKAAFVAAQSQVIAAQSSIEAARSQVIQAQSAIEAALANVERINAEIDDSILKAPRDGRVQYRIVQPGEVVGSGGKVVSLVDLEDVYMTFFLPERAAGKLAIGSDVRIIVDAAPQYVVPAKISYVASIAQFTPKTVETASERQKLVFRVKAKIDPSLLKQYKEQVKTGLPGVAYVRLNQDIPWPENLNVRLPQ